MNVAWSLRAANDLRRYCQFIARDRPKAAADVNKRLLAAVDRLAEHPLSAAKSTARDTRALVVSGTGAVVIYRVQNETVNIVTIRHQMRRPLKG
ncbi:MAG: type II toxin-antitoxin system RelE/ParE family toxin [Alphaproteobacteria bacterium]|nr:type II toxin-antitoxin system RelE/ParE family toxin [Alphaproteobacteria bacterium]MBU2380770.1 type II toxin-antitoxin system RelE/ParE family toxin [Alphaproteobacteria bacterium]